MSSVEEALKRIEDKLDRLDNRLNEFIERDIKEHGELEKRIAILEELQKQREKSKRNHLTEIIAISSIISIIITIIAHFI